MIELRGKRQEIARAVKGIAPEWPVQLIEQLEPGEWHFTSWAREDRHDAEICTCQPEECREQLQEICMHVGGRDGKLEEL